MQYVFPIQTERLNGAQIRSLLADGIRVHSNVMTALGWLDEDLHLEDEVHGPVDLDPDSTHAVMFSLGWGFPVDGLPYLRDGATGCGYCPNDRGDEMLKDMLAAQARANDYGQAA